MAAKLVEIHKAMPSPAALPSTVISIVDEIPEFTELKYQDNFCDKEAAELEEALYGCLPGAIYDRLLGLMLRRKASHFRVTHSA